MDKRGLLLIIGAMACCTAAIACLIILQMQSNGRTERNVQVLCDRLEELDGQPCELMQPSDTETRLFAFVRRG